MREGTFPLAEASALGTAYVSAYKPHEVTGQLSKHSGKTIFIPGGAGGVGRFAVQLCKLYGLTVISSGGKPASLDPTTHSGSGSRYRLQWTGHSKGGAAVDERVGCGLCV